MSIYCFVEIGMDVMPVMSRKIPTFVGYKF